MVARCAYLPIADTTSSAMGDQYMRTALTFMEFAIGGALLFGLAAYASSGLVMLIGLVS